VQGRHLQPLEDVELCPLTVTNAVFPSGSGFTEQGQADNGTEQRDKNAVLPFDAMEACFKLREAG